MKKIYKILLGLFGVEWFYVIVLSITNVQITSWAGNVVGILQFIAPIVGLLYLLSTDKEISEGKRKISKISLWFLLFCFIAGAIGEAIERGLIMQ